MWHCGGHGNGHRGGHPATWTKRERVHIFVGLEWERQKNCMDKKKKCWMGRMRWECTTIKVSSSSNCEKVIIHCLDQNQPEQLNTCSQNQMK